MALKERKREERMNVLPIMFVTLSTLHLLKSRLKTDASRNTKKDITMKKNKNKKMTTKILKIIKYVRTHYSKSFSKIFLFQLFCRRWH